MVGTTTAEMLWTTTQPSGDNLTLLKASRIAKRPQQCFHLSCDIVFRLNECFLFMGSMFLFLLFALAHLHHMGMLKCFLSLFEDPGPGFVMPKHAEEGPSINWAITVSSLDSGGVIRVDVSLPLFIIHTFTLKNSSPKPLAHRGD